MATTTIERPVETVVTNPTASHPQEVLYIKPHVIDLPLKGGLLKKGSVRKGQLGGSLALDVHSAAVGGSGGTKKKGGVVASKLSPLERDFCVQLNQLRDTAIAALADLGWTADAVDRAVVDYLALLQGLTEQRGLSDDSSLTKGTQPSPRHKPPRIAQTLAFQWYDIFGPSKRDSPPVSGDAALELSSVLLSLAVWKACTAAALCNRPKFSEGVSSEECSTAYKLLREAAGLVPKLVELGGSSASQDLGHDMLSALESLFLADAQSLSTLRAIEKGNSPAVVSSVARDTAELYSSALKRLQTDGQGWGAKLQAYTVFKAEAFRAHAHIALAQQRLADEVAGEAVRSAEEAKRIASEAAKLGTAYDKAGGVSSDPREHASFSGHLRGTVEHAADRVVRMNSMIYYKAPSSELPALPEATRLAQPLPFTLPQLSELVKSLQSSLTTDSEADATPENGEGAEGQGAASGEVQGGDEKPGAGSKPGSPPSKSSGTCCCVIQ